MNLCKCGHPCTVCGQLEGAKTAAFTLADALVAGALHGLMSGLHRVNPWAHLCTEHRQLIAAAIDAHHERAKTPHPGAVH